MLAIGVPALRIISVSFLLAGFCIIAGSVFQGRGSVPSEDMAAINSILDSGITFWHTSAIGNYSASNGII